MAIVAGYGWPLRTRTDAIECSNRDGGSGDSFPGWQPESASSAVSESIEGVREREITNQATPYYGGCENDHPATGGSNLDPPTRTHMGLAARSRHAYLVRCP